MVTSSVSEQVMQSPEAVSISDLATSSLDESESDEPDHWYSSDFLLRNHHQDWDGPGWNGWGRFLHLLLVIAGPSFQYHFGCVLITL